MSSDPHTRDLHRQPRDVLTEAKTGERSCPYRMQACAQFQRHSLAHHQYDGQQRQLPLQHSIQLISYRSLNRDCGLQLMRHAVKCWHVGSAKACAPNRLDHSVLSQADHVLNSQTLVHWTQGCVQNANCLHSTAVWHHVFQMSSCTHWVLLVDHPFLRHLHLIWLRSL